MPKWSRLTDEQREWAKARGYDEGSWDRRHREINAGEDVDYERSHNSGFDWDKHFAELGLRRERRKEGDV